MSDPAGDGAMQRRRRRSSGFTLVEVLAVLAILSLLMGLAIYGFGKQKERGAAVATAGTIEQLELLISRFETKKGGPPPDTLAGAKVRADNDLNEGAEALFCGLHARSFPEGDNLGEAMLGNTDEDSTATAFHREAGITALLEALDAWGNPIAYFTPVSYGKEQRYLMGDPADPNDPEQRVTARKSEVTGGFANSDRFQLISAGPDRLFGTEDDVTN